MGSDNSPRVRLDWSGAEWGFRFRFSPLFEPVVISSDSRDAGIEGVSGVVGYVGEVDTVGGHTGFSQNYICITFCWIYGYMMFQLSHPLAQVCTTVTAGYGGPRLTKVYSHSSLNLPATGDTSSSEVKPHSRLDSPCRPDKDCDPSSGGPSSAPDYTGPKLFKEPSFKSNKFIIHNALTRCCLAGRVNEMQKNKIVEEMEKSAANHFLILFRDSSCQFRGVYTLSPDAQELVRLTGVGPRAVSCAHVESIYKYSSDRKQFCPIPSKTLGMSVDAFTIPGPLWQGAGAGANRRTSITRKNSASAK